MPDEGFFRTLPIWGAGQPAPPMNPTGPGPGMQGPDYAKPRPPQSGEGLDTLPHFEGSDSQVAAANRAKKPPSVRRMAPYLLLQGTVQFGLTSDNSLYLGRPNKGYRWSVREVVIVPGTALTDLTFTAASNFLAAFFVGTPALAHPGGALTQVSTLTDVVEVYDKASNAVIPGSGYINFSKTYGPNQIQVLENQALYAQVLQSGSAAPVVFLARVEQFPTSTATNVEEV
jgi:hypothetical protein